MLRRALVLLLIFVAGPAQAVDSDGDGIDDLADNCFEAVNPDQRDSDGDLYGNRCDPDFNNDGRINFADLAVLRQQFFASGDLEADLDGDGAVNFADLSILSEMLFGIPGPSGLAAAAVELQLVPVFGSVAVSSPIAMHQAPGDPAHWYIAQRNGLVLRFDNVAVPGTADIVLDIRSRVDTTFEGGLLDFAFDPDFQSNGRLYASYTATGDGIGNPLDSRIGRFERVAGDPAAFDADSELLIVEIDQPFANHNGGGLAFGHDGMLYLALGDGGSGGDPDDHGQNTTTLLGAMLRFDVSEASAAEPYRIPPGNPFASSVDCSTGCPEIFAWGLRNPFRFSFDRRDGDLYAGDVGQRQREEIDLIVAGGNYGWRCYEGNLAFMLTGCASPSAYIFPLIDYPRTEGTTVTGGYVYRGSAHPALSGVYLYGDFGTGRIWGLVAGAALGELVNSTVRLVSFAEGLDGELYVLDLYNDAIYRIDVAP